VIDHSLSGPESPTRSWTDAGWLGPSGPRGLVLPFGLAVAVGVVVALTPWWFPFGLLLGSVVMLIVAVKPLAGVVLTFMLVFQAIPATLVPDIPLGFFKLKPYEFVFLWTIGVFTVRSLFERPSPKATLPAFTFSMAFMLFWAVIGVVYGKYFMQNGSLVLADARGFLGLLVAPAIQIFIRDRKEIDRLSVGIGIVGVVLSAFILVQAMTGMKILDGRAESLDQGANADITRSVVPGVAVQAFALYYFTLALFSKERTRVWMIPAILILLLGLLATFGRGAWMTVALGGLVVAFLAGRWRGLVLAAVVGTMMVMTTLAAAYVLKPRVAEAALERALGIGHELSAGGSWGWRQRENVRALEVISEKPLLGVGLGGVYKQLVVAEDPAFALEAHFIHNSYLYFPLKMGVIAGLGPILVAGAFLVLLLRYYRRSAGHMSAAAIASTGVIIQVYLGAVSGPTLKTFPGLLSLGAALAICAAAYRFSREEPAPASPRESGEPVRPAAMSPRVNQGASA